MQSDHYCDNCLGVDPDSCMFNKPAPTWAELIEREPVLRPEDFDAIADLWHPCPADRQLAESEIGKSLCGYRALEFLADHEIVIAKRYGVHAAIDLDDPDTVYWEGICGDDLDLVIRMSVAKVLYEEQDPC